MLIKDLSNEILANTHNIYEQTDVKYFSNEILVMTHNLPRKQI